VSAALPLPGDRRPGVDPDRRRVEHEFVVTADPDGDRVLTGLVDDFAVVVGRVRQSAVERRSAGLRPFLCRRRPGRTGRDACGRRARRRRPEKAATTGRRPVGFARTFGMHTRRFFTILYKPD
jgi:hypothetical protein